jgi:hypothetical protein
MSKKTAAYTTFIYHHTPNDATTVTPIVSVLFSMQLLAQHHALDTPYLTQQEAGISSWLLVYAFTATATWLRRWYPGAHTWCHLIIYLVADFLCICIGCNFMYA